MEGTLASLPTEGMPDGSAPRPVPLDTRIHVVVSDVPSSIYSAETLEARLADLEWVSRAGAAHHSVVDSIATAGVPILPFRLFTIFSNEKVATATLRDKRAAMRGAFQRVRGRQEWVLRIGKPERSRAEDGPGTSASTRASGTNFLQGKVDARREAAARATRAHTDAVAAAAALEPLADRAKTRPVDPAGNLLIDAAFLLPESRVEQAQRVLIDRSAGLLREGCSVSFTGPWPPYSFASMESQDDE